jgi:CheY-like chemotaxis protein
VDDNTDAATTLGRLLRLGGHEVCTAHDGEEAVAAADAFRPEVVLLDIGLPRLDGFEAARRIRAQPWGRQIRLIALTGWGQDEDRRRSKEAGFDDHLVKPVDLDELRGLLAGPP